MPLSSREIKTAAFTVPFLFSPPSSPAPFFFPPTRGTKMRTNQYSPTYLPRDHNLQKRNPWKNGSVPSFPSFVPWNGRNLCHDRESNETRPYPTAEMKEPAWTCATFSLRANKFFAPTKNLHAFPPDSKVSRCGDITYRLISFSRVFPNTSPPNRAKQPELSQKTCHLALSRFHGECKDGNIYIERERGTERGSKEDREMYLDERRKYYPPGGRANNFLRLIFGGEGLFTRVKQRANISSYRFVAVERIEIASSPSKIPSSSVYSRPFSQRHEWGKLEENGGNKELYKCPNYLKDRISKGSWSLEKFEISVLILFVLESRPPSSANLLA